MQIACCQEPKVCLSVRIHVGVCIRENKYSESTNRTNMVNHALGLQIALYQIQLVVYISLTNKATLSLSYSSLFQQACSVMRIRTKL